MESKYLLYNGYHCWTDDGTETGTFHCEDGPAYMRGEWCEWYYEGLKYNFVKWCYVTRQTPEDILFLKLKYKIS